MKINFFWILRIFLGAFFAVIGFLKLMEPAENMMAIVSAYEVPYIPLRFAAVTLPWLEFLLGIFLVFGLCLPQVLRLFLLLSSAFFLTVLQAILRKLPIDDCGCFGDLIHIPLYGTLFVDVILLTSFLLLIKSQNKVYAFSLDNYFSE